MKFIHLLDPIQNMFSVYVQQDDDESKKTNKRKWSQCQFSFNVMPKRYITERILSCLDATFYDDMSIPNDIEMNTSHNYRSSYIQLASYIRTECQCLYDAVQNETLPDGSPKYDRLLFETLRYLLRKIVQLDLYGLIDSELPTKKTTLTTIQNSTATITIPMYI